MSVTITGGISFSGGVGIVAAPPSVATAAWIAGGTPGYSTIQRITFATDTATASLRGSLPYGMFGGAGVGTLTYGYFGGGYAGSPLSLSSSINRVTYASDTGTATTRGLLSIAKYMSGTGAVGNSTYGWFNGGNGASPRISNVDRITYSNDTATASNRGPLSVGRESLASVGNDNYGWCAAGFITTSLVDRIDYANDTATASVRGPLNGATYKVSGSSDGTSYGWIGGGNPGGSTVQRITYSNDTATASTRGPLTTSRNSINASGDNSYGYFTGGNPTTSLVDRITYSNDTATATARGPLALAVYSAGAAAGLQ